MPPSDSKAALIDELAEEVAHRCRAGERPTTEEYAKRYPELADELRAVLSAVLLMEEMKPRREEAVRRSGAPERIGDYRVVREIGRGGMGVVYEAEQEALGRRVALKVLPAHLLADERSRARFRREAKAAARLHHTNIVPVFGIGESDGLCYYVMQLIQGRGLDRVLSEGPDTMPLEVSSEPVPPRSAMPLPDHCRAIARIGAQVADALAYAHAQGVLHRDVKPSNLLLDDRGAVWVADFGVAKMVEEAKLTQSGDLVGTLRYMPPERFAGQSDARGDVYSLGVTLYELLAGRSAYPDTNPQHLIHLITSTPLTPLRRVAPHVPADLETIILKAAARDPAHRYQSAAEMAEDLRRFQGDRPILARRAGPGERAWRWCRRNPAVAFLATTAFVLMLAVTAVSVIAYIRTAVANRETAAALKAEQDQREQAEKTATLSLAALARMYDRFTPTRMVATAQTTSEEGVQLPPPSLPPEAAPLLEDLSRTYEQIARSAGKFPRLHAQAAEANHRIGDIRQRQGRLEEACAAYRSAIDLYSGLPEGAPAVKLARAHNELGRALRALQKVDESEKAFDCAIEALAAAPPALGKRPESRYELARAYYLLGQRDLMRTAPPGPPRPGDPGRRPPGFGRGGPWGTGGPGGPPEPDPNLRRAIGLLEKLVADHRSVPEYRHLLACCYRDTPGPPRPGEGPDRGIELLRQLVKDFPRVPDYRLDLCEALGGTGPPERPDPRFSDRMQEAITLSAELVASYPGVPEYRAAHARYHDRLGMRLVRAGRFEEAEKAHRKAVDIQSKLMQHYPDVVAYEFWLCLMERSLGKALTERDQLTEARERLQNATKRAEALRKKAPKLGGLPPFLRMAYRDLADAHSRAGDKAAAAEARKKAEPFGTPLRGPGRPGPG